MVDYVKLAATAVRLINANGRDIDLIRKDQTANDPLKPWDGPPLRSEIPTTVKAVFVPPNTIRQFGLTALGQGTEYIDLITMSERIAIVQPGILELRDYTDVQEVDDLTLWGIIGLQVLKPGNVQLLAFIGVRR